MNHPTHIPLDISLEAATSLHAGALKCILEKGALRYIGSEKQEWVRMVYGAVRDDQWNTADYSIEQLKVDSSRHSITVCFTAIFQFDQPVYRMDIVIKASEDNSITYAMEGLALTDFMTNRTGLCVLLPIASCRGQTATVRAPGGSTHLMTFPGIISPHQPAKNITGIEWRTPRHTQVRVDFEGDVFEMEDQRNWMDHSYKIYNRPLELPFPYIVKKGEKHSQKVIIRISTNQQATTNIDNNQKIKSEKLTIPNVGIYLVDDDWQKKNQPVSWTPDHLKLELGMAGDWESKWKKGIDQARRLQTGIELIALFTPEYKTEAAALREMMESDPAIVKSLLPLHKDHEVTPDYLSDHLYQPFKEAFPDLRIGYGTDLYFAELNRNRPTGPYYDFVSFSLNPQVHARDTRTLLENLKALPDIIATVKSFTDKPIYISPLSLRRRAEKAPTGFLEEDPDERIHTRFAAGWYLQALYDLRGVEQVTLSLPSFVIRDIGDSKSPYHQLFQTLDAGPESR